MAANGASQAPLRIVVGCDNAGVVYKDALKETLQKHKGVKEVLDVGVNDAKDSKAYPHSAVDAARKIKNGEVGTCSVTNHLLVSIVLTFSRPTALFSSVAQVSVLLSAQIKLPAFEP